MPSKIRSTAFENPQYEKPGQRLDTVGDVQIRQFQVGHQIGIIAQIPAGAFVIQNRLSILSRLIVAVSEIIENRSSAPARFDNHLVAVDRSDVIAGQVSLFGREHPLTHINRLRRGGFEREQQKNQIRYDDSPHDGFSQIFSI